MWRSEAASPPVAASPPPPAATAATSSSAASDAMWKFDASSAAAASSNSSSSSSKNNTTSSSSTHGVIGSGSRFLWSRMAPEEEEREEEALPSYLSYLQPAFRHSTSGELAPLAFDGGVSAAALPRRQSLPGSMGLGHPATTPPFVPAAQQQQQQQQRMLAAATGRAYAAPQPSYFPSVVDETASGQVEAKSRELAAALQDFVRAQVQDQTSAKQQQQLLPPGLAMNGAAVAATCNCDPLKARVSELELQLQTLQSQVTSLLKSGMGNTSNLLQPPLPPGASVPMAIPMALAQPPLPPGAQPSPSPTAAAGVSHVAQQLSPGVAASAMSDRVSTLEGRQSAFQSQLAQISKVLGVPVGKHGKNSQVKTLVQTLREEIDAKVAAVSTELETKCVESVTAQLEHVVERVAKEELCAHAGAASAPSLSTSLPNLSYETVLGALAEEHEASLAKLSAYFEERLLQESKQRVGLESRIATRFGEQEEWLQQLEGEFGSWHDTSSSVAAQIRAIQHKLAEVEDKWRGDVAKWSKLSLAVAEPPAATADSSNSSSGVSPSSSSSNSGKGKKQGSNAAGAVANAGSQHLQLNGAASAVSADAFSRSVQQLQMQFKHFQSEYKTDSTELRENLALMETWVKTTRQESRDLAKNAKGMKQLVEKLVRDTGSAEELLQQYVSTITHQVASVTRQYVSVRIRDNNRLIDATLRARVPAYAENESESFMLVRPETKGSVGSLEESKLEAGGSSNSPGPTGSLSSVSVVLKDDDEEGIRRLLAAQKMHLADRSSSGSSTSAGTATASVPSSPDVK